MAIGTSFGMVDANWGKFTQGVPWEFVVDAKYDGSRLYARGAIHNNSSNTTYTGTNKSYRLIVKDSSGNTKIDTGTVKLTSSFSPGEWKHVPSGDGLSFESSGGTYTFQLTWSVTDAQSKTYSGNGTAIGPPKSLGYSVSNIEWDTTNNRMKLTGTASCNWNGGTGSSLQFIVNKTSGSLGDRWAFEVGTTATSGSKVCYAVSTSNHNSVFNQNGDTFPIKGCMDFYIGAWANNTSNFATGVVGTTKYSTPPSPITAASKTGTTKGLTAVTHTCSMTGGTSGSGTTGNNYAVTITNQYRVSADNGATWVIDWTSAGTGKTSDTKTFSFEHPYDKPCLVEVRQAYNSEYTVAKQIEIDAVPAEHNPGYGSVNGKARQLVRILGSVDGKAHEVVKVYGSVNGKATRIW